MVGLWVDFLRVWKKMCQLGCIRYIMRVDPNYYMGSYWIIKLKIL